MRAFFVLGLLTLVCFTLLFNSSFLVVVSASSSTSSLSRIELVICPDPKSLTNVVAKSSNGRVYVVFANESLDVCVGRAFKLAKGLKMDAEVKLQEELYTDMLQASINELLTSSNVTSSLRLHVSKYGYKISHVVAYGGGRVVGVIVETPKPGGLGEEFARLVLLAAGKAFGERLEKIFIVYTSPLSDKIIEELTFKLSDLVKERVVIGIGVAGGIPIVEILSTKIGQRGGVQGFADYIAKLLPVNGWIIVVVYDDIPKVRYQNSGAELLSKTINTYVSSKSTAPITIP